MRRATVTGLCALLISPALAADADCERFAWNLDRERALLAAARDDGPLAPPAAVRIGLKPLASAALPVAPERSPRRADGHAGSAMFRVVEPGTYRVTLDAAAWIDVLQEGAARKAGASTSARGCDGLRKSVRFRLETGDAIVQVSDASAATIGVALTKEP